MWSTTTGAGRDIVFIHGWTMDHRDEMRTYELLFARRPGWRRHYVDLPGMGRSPPDPQIVDMDGMLNALIGWVGLHLVNGHFVVAGTSVGAYLVRGLLARLGDRIDGALLRAPLVIPDDRARDVDPVVPLVVDPRLVEAIDIAERQALGDVLVQTPAYLGAVRAKLRDAVTPAQTLADDAFLAPIRRDPSRYSFSFDVDAQASAFAGPSLIVAGRHDSNVGFRDAWRLAAKWPRATYAVLDRAEHGLPIDQQPLFTALVNDWLDRVEETSPRAA